MPLSDEALFERFRRRRDTAALGELFDRTAPDLFRLALFLAPEASLAEDLVQATFLTAIESAEAFDGARRVGPWLMGVLANHARRARRQGKRQIAPEMLTLREVPDPRVAAENKEVGDSLRATLAELRQPYRQVLTLHLEHGLNAKQIAAVLEAPAGTVRSQIVRGMQLLKRALPIGVTVGVAAMMTPGHALAGVRQEVLRQAERATPVAPAPAGHAGALLGVAAAIVVTVGAYVWTTQFGGHEGAPDGVAVTTANAEVFEAPRPEAVEPQLAVGSGAERTRVEPAPLPAVVTVRAADSSGKPVAGLGFELVPSPEYRELVAVLQQGTGRAFAVTDEDGRASFADVDPGRVMLRAFGARQQDTFDVRAGQRVERPFVVGSTARIDGSVVDAAGAPVAGAKVFASWSRGRVEVGDPVAETDADGRFEFVSAESRVFVWAEADGHVASLPQVPRGALELALGSNGGAVAGRVVDEDGRGVADAVVALFQSSRHPNPERHGGAAPRYQSTDARGGFRFTDVAAGGVAVVARKRGRGTASRPADVAVGECSDVVVELPKAARLHGRIVDESGRARSGCVVMTEVSSSGRGVLDAIFRCTSVVVGNDGSFDLVDLPAEAVRVRVVDRGMQTWLHQRTFRFAPGESIEWNPGSELQRCIRGRLVDADGTGIAGRVVAATPTGSGSERVNAYRRRHAHTHADGSYEIGGLERGVSYRLTAYGAGVTQPAPEISVVAESAVPVLAGARPSDLLVDPDLEATAVVTGRVVGPDGAPFEDAELLVRRVPSSRVSTSPIVVGRFACGPLLPGRYQFGVRNAETGSQWGEVVAVAHAAIDLGVFHVESPARVAVRAVDAEGREVDDVGLRLRAVASESAVDFDEALAPGRYEVHVHGSAVTPRITTVDLRAGERRTVEVPVTRAPQRELRFPFEALDNTWDGPGPLHVTIRPAGGAPIYDDHVVPDGSGAFVLRLGLPPALYEVSATSIWGGRAERRVDLRHDASGVVTLPLEAR